MRNVLVCAGVAALAAVLSAQGTVSNEGDMRALVAEIRGLRADLNRVAGTTVRSQLLVGRLQLQEERILTMSRQIADVEKELAGVVQGRVANENEIKRAEEMLHVRVEEREHLEAHVKRLRPQIAQQRAREQQLRLQQSSLSALLAEEQTRWTDFSSRLDELERALASARDR
jgi:septal ring factor EnvC (AmiA/AmiB activator)